MHTCLWPAALILFLLKWRNLATASLLLHYNNESSFLGCWNEFFPSVFQVLGWCFLVLHLYGNVCKWTPKLIWSQIDWFWGVFLNMVISVDLLSAWTEVCMNSPNLFPFWRHQLFSITSLKDTLVCCSNVLVLLAIKLSNIDWYALALQCNFTFYLFRFPV